MSGFTTTPNLGLKKPTTGADNDLWGGHLNENADTLDAAVAGKAATVHTHTASQITDFAEATDDRVAALLVQGANVSLNYNDVANTLTISASGGGGGMSGPITAGGVLSGGTITSTGTIGLVIGTGLTSAANGIISLAPATYSVLGGVVAGGGVTIDAAGTISVAGGGSGMSGPIITSGGIVVYPATSGDGTITASGTIKLGNIPSYSVLGTGNFAGIPAAVALGAAFNVVGSTLNIMPATTSALGGVLVPTGGGLGLASGTLSNSGVISLAGGTGTLTLGTGIARSGQAINLQAATGSALGGVVTGTGITNSSGTISAAVGTVTTIVAGGVLTGGTITASGTIGLAVTNGILNTSGTLSNSGVLSVDSATGALLIGAGLTRSSQTLSAGAVVAATAPTVPDNTLWFDSTGGQLYIKYNDGNTSQFVSATNLAGSSVLTTVGLTGSLTDTLPTGTYDLGPVIQGGTVVNSYAHVASGTLTYTAAIGAPGSLTNVTGMVALTASTTTSDSVGTATAPNVLTAGQHLWVIVAGTAAPGATVFFTVRVP